MHIIPKIYPIKPKNIMYNPKKLPKNISSKKPVNTPKIKFVNLFSNTQILINPDSTNSGLNSQKLDRTLS